MFKFENTYFLYGLSLIPVFVIVFFFMLRWKKRALNKFGESSVISQLLPDVSKSRAVFKFVILMFAFASLMIGLANPQIGSKLEKVQRKGVDLIIALDVSNSMLAEDIKPNRLIRAKQAISKLVDRLQNDRIGIVVFAGTAYTQLPITSDYSAAKMFLSTVNTNVVSTQGTAIGSAIKLAEKSFSKGEKNNKAIIIITDGENHEDDAIEQAKIVADKGIIVHTIGMGLPKGAPIPVYKNQYSKDYKKDNSENTIITRLNETMLQQIAAAGKGTYVRANNTKAGLNKIFKEINKMEKVEFDSKIFTDYEDRFQYFIAFCLILLILEVFIFEKKSKWAGKLNLFREKSA